MDCKHLNYTPAGYRSHNNEIRLQSAYWVYCLDCQNHINLLTGENINNLGLVHNKKGESHE